MTIATLLIALIATPSGDATGEPLLLDFHASWCGPCQQMRPAIEQLIQKGYRVKSVDVDDSPELAARYHVKDVPTFIIVDSKGRALAQTKGSQPAIQLAKMYLAAKSKAKPEAARRGPRVEDVDDRDRENGDDAPANIVDADADADDGEEEADEPAEERDRPARPHVNPKPWETTVRIKVHGQGSIGFGSGTIIYSTPEESVILTCAHIFKLEGRQQAHPSRFPRRITVDLFDGNLSGSTVHYANETYEGKAIDYDFTRDVGLIRIRPGRKLPASRVVPKRWQPQARMLMTTVGCSEGHDATAWNTTIVSPSMHGLAGNPQYEAIECITAPKQGRSGGGLYTSDGYVAGVCDFAEPRGNHGLYATPTSIYSLLDRNDLKLCYAPADRNGKDSSQTLLANNRPGPRRKTGPAIARAQSPDRDESDVVMIPPPELLGIKSPATETPTRTASTSRNWSASHPRAERTDLKLDPESDSDRFGSMPPEADPQDEEPAPRPNPRTSGGKWRPAGSPLPSLSTDR
jgi:thiol-disulfide isomerase/thioredoxin